MVLLLDIDKLFSDFLPDYIDKHCAGLTPEEIENKIDEIYNAFTLEPLKVTRGKTVTEYYDGFTAEELCLALGEHINSGIPPSAYLTDAITNKDGGEDILLGYLSSDNEELAVYALNLLADKGYDKFDDKLLDFILTGENATLSELSTEILSTRANAVRGKILLLYDDATDGVKANLCEILSYTNPSEKVLSILLDEFNSHPENIPLYAQFLGRFGDEKALPVLLDMIEKDSIDYADYQELKSAIEMLGGEYEKKKDFSNDKAFLAVKKVDDEINN